MPRFHIIWGTGPGIVEPFERRVRAHAATGRVRLAFRHRVDGLTTSGGAVTASTGWCWPRTPPRGRPTNREVNGEFAVRAQAVVVTSGGIGGDHALVRANWPDRLGPRRPTC